METDPQTLIIIAIISAGLGTLVSGLWQIVHKLIDNGKEKRIAKQQVEKEFCNKKEQAYIAAIRRLLFIRQGFDITKEDILQNSILRKKFNDENVTSLDIAPLIRLYSSDEIYNCYYNLMKYKDCAYVSEQNSLRLFEDSKWAFEIQVTILSRLMQEDLGYRVFDKDTDKIKCPGCGCEHDLVSTCPKCKMSFRDKQIKLNEIMKKAQEINMEENEDIEKEIKS